jgi:hypothetical protein
MWERQRPVRSEVISIDTDRLARRAFAQMGLVCIRAVPAANGHTKLFVSDTSELKPAADAVEYWFPKLKHATDVLDEVVMLEGMTWAASAIDGGVLVATPLDAIDTVIAESMRWVRYARQISRAEIDARISSVKQQIDRSLVRLQSTGAMKILNQEYKATRTRPRAEGEKAPPPFRLWATRQLEHQILQLMSVAA